MPDKEQQQPLTHVATSPPDESSETATATSAVNAASVKKEQLFRLFLLFLMTAQNSSVVLLSRYTRAGIKSEDLYVINDMVMVTEMAKVRILGLAVGSHCFVHARFVMKQCHLGIK